MQYLCFPASSIKCFWHYIPWVWHRQCSWHWVGSPLALWTWLWRCLLSHHSWSLCRSAPALCYCLCEWSGKCIYHLHYNQTEKQAAFHNNCLFTVLWISWWGLCSFYQMVWFLFPKRKLQADQNASLQTTWDCSVYLLSEMQLTKINMGRRWCALNQWIKVQLQVRPQFILWLAATVCTLCCIPEYKAS